MQEISLKISDMQFEFTPIAREMPIVPSHMNSPSYLQQRQGIILRFVVETDVGDGAFLDTPAIYDIFQIGTVREFDIHGNIIKGIVHSIEMEPISGTDSFYQVKLTLIEGQVVEMSEEVKEEWSKPLPKTPPPKPQPTFVVCINALGLEDQFTEGEEYEVIRTSGELTHVLNDDGEKVEVFSERFEKQTEVTV